MLLIYQNEITILCSGGVRITYFETKMSGLPPGLLRSGQDCATCPYGTKGLTQCITCNSKHFIYMRHCKLCHLQYIGETKRRLKDRFNEHRRTIEKLTLNLNPALSPNIFFLIPI